MTTAARQASNPPRRPGTRRADASRRDEAGSRPEVVAPRAREPTRASAAPAPRRAARNPIRPRNLPLLLLQAREAVLARFRPLLHANGVTEQQWRVVRALAETGPLEPRQIVALCGISSPSLAGVLSRMEALGLIERERLEHDQRRQQVRLTASSRALIATMAPEVEATYGALEQALGKDALVRLHAQLDDLIERLGPGDGEGGE
jgi:homoprotocatechuate degradation regulator HpaR